MVVFLLTLVALVGVVLCILAALGERQERVARGPRQPEARHAALEASPEFEAWLHSIGLPALDDFHAPTVGGAGRYVRLRADDLDATVERDRRRALRPGWRPLELHDGLGLPR